MASPFDFEPDYTVRGRHYEHSLISWSSIAAGTLVAIALGVLFNLVGLAIGAGLFNPYNLNRSEDALTVGGGLYALFAQFVALEVGAYVAARSARFPDHFGGALTGFIVWALAVVFAITFARGMFGGGDLFARQMAISALNARETAAAGDLAAADEQANALATMAWWSAGALALGFAGAIAGGWIGAHHPKWEHRPRRDERVINPT